MHNVIRHCFTGHDNQTFDLGRVLWAFGVIAFIFFAGYHVYSKGEFDAIGYGGGLGGLLAGGGASLGFKSKTEPE